MTKRQGVRYFCENCSRYHYGGSKLFEPHIEMRGMGVRNYSKEIKERNAFSKAVKTGLLNRTNVAGLAAFSLSPSAKANLRAQAEYNRKKLNW